MKIKTTRFGEVDIPEQDIYEFPEGLLGFAPIKQYFVIDHPGEGPFKWLQAMEPPSLAFVVCDPLLFQPEYRVRITQEDLDLLQLDRIDDGVVLVIMVVPKDPKLMTANLQGPLVINPKKMLGKQLVMHGEEYSTKYRVFQADGEAVAHASPEAKQ